MTKRTAADPAAPLSFEQALSELETIVEAMEGHTLPLDQSVAAYQRGAALIATCRVHLETARDALQVVDASGELKPLD